MGDGLHVYAISLIIGEFYRCVRPTCCERDEIYNRNKI